MTCTLSVHRAADTLALPLSASGRLVVHLDGGGSVEIENSPTVASDAGGELPIYRGAVLAFTVPFTCPGEQTFAAGASGGGTSAGGTEGGCSSAGSRLGRLF